MTNFELRNIRWILILISAVIASTARVSFAEEASNPTTESEAAEPESEAPEPESEAPEPESEAPEPESEAADDFSDRWVNLSLEVGVYIPTIVNDMTPHVTTELEVGLQLPFHGRRLSVVVAGAYSPPGNEGSQQDPRIGDAGGEWSYDMTTHEVFLSLGLVYRIFPPGSRIVVPYIGAFARLYLLHTRVSGSAEGEPFGENTEQSTQAGFSVALGGEVKLGPGAVLFEAIFGYSSLPHEITGDTSTGSLAVTVGYRLFL